MKITSSAQGSFILYVFPGFLHLACVFRVPSSCMCSGFLHLVCVFICVCLEFVIKTGCYIHTYICAVDLAKRMLYNRLKVDREDHL